jgi:hypothetical protein
LSTHYTVQLDLERPLEKEGHDGTLLLVVQFRDILTGLTHSAQRQLNL